MAAAPKLDRGNKDGRSTKVNVPLPRSAYIAGGKAPTSRRRRVESCLAAIDADNDGIRQAELVSAGNHAAVSRSLNTAKLIWIHRLINRRIRFSQNRHLVEYQDVHSPCNPCEIGLSVCGD